ncbi:MAG: M28 family peptidase [Alphaproteobacteria bacterium]
MSELLPNVPSNAVNGAEMMDNLRHIAHWVKLSGTDEEREALNFIEKRMRDYGYTTKILLHDAYISLPGTASVRVAGKPTKAITQSFSCPSPPGGISGLPVYVGHGTEEDFAGKDLRGRILLMEGMATPAAARRARLAGAIAELHISHHEHIHEMCISPIWGSPGEASLAELPTTVVCSISHAEGSALREALQAGRQPLITMEAEVDTGWRKTPILVAELPGPAEEDNPFVLFSGHHDTWYHGVMDNGSANAGMMEVARLCAKNHSAWQRGLRICFWSGHSHGRYSGSAWYADAHWQELDQFCVAHVNVDSLGGMGATVLANAAAMAELHDLAHEAISLHTNETYKGKRKNRSSDDSFVGIGIPSMFGTLGEQPHKHQAARNALGWWWHTADDLIDKVDETNLVRDTRVMLHVVWRLLTSPILPLNHLAMLQSLQSEIDVLAKRLDDTIPISRLQTSLLEAIGLAERLGKLGAPKGTQAARKCNAALMRVSRALVPADYTDGDRFLHPHALPMPAWATLEPIRRLAETTAGTDAAKFAAVDALRAQNRIAFAVRQAKEALNEAIVALG